MDRLNEKSAGVGRGMRRAGIAVRRALRDYFRNVSGKAVRTAEGNLSRIVEEGRSATDRLSRDVAARYKALSSVKKKIKYLSGRIGRNASDADKYRNLARGKRLIPDELGNEVLSARESASRARQEFEKLLARFPDPATRPSRTMNKAFYRMQDAEARAASKLRELTQDMADRSVKQVNSISGREASRKAKLVTALNGLNAEKALASDALSEAQKNLSKAVSGYASRTRGAEQHLSDMVKARRAARVGTAVYGGGAAGGIGLGALLSLNGDQEKKSEAYLRGFAEKCAEYGLDADVSMALLEKEAFKVKVPGKAAVREGAKRVGGSMKTYWGHLSGKTARRAGEARDAVRKSLEQARNEVRRHHTRENVRREVELLYQDAEAAKAFRKAKHTRNVVRGRTAAGVAVAGGGGGVVVATRGGKKGGQEKKSSHDPAMRKVAEVLAAFVEGMECRR